MSKGGLFEQDYPGRVSGLALLYDGAESARWVLFRDPR